MPLHDQQVDDLTARDVPRHGDVKTTIRSYIKGSAAGCNRRGE
jgi:hypothetical protein